MTGLVAGINDTYIIMEKFHPMISRFENPYNSVAMLKEIFGENVDVRYEIDCERRPEYMHGEEIDVNEGVIIQEFLDYKYYLMSIINLIDQVLMQKPKEDYRRGCYAYPYRNDTLLNYPLSNNPMFNKKTKAHYRRVWKEFMGSRKYKKMDPKKNLLRNMPIAELDNIFEEHMMNIAEKYPLVYRLQNELVHTKGDENYIRKLKELLNSTYQTVIFLKKLVDIALEASLLFPELSHVCMKFHSKIRDIASNWTQLKFPYLPNSVYSFDPVHVPRISDYCLEVAVAAQIIDKIVAKAKERSS
ncbi:unnamed protein product [Caenorhabditis bovis]|nr:unnamed protein product [Caenorhabditis bovis]